jgi:hypothetical protein
MTHSLKTAIFSILKLNTSSVINNAIENSKSKKRRVPASHGEVLTSDEALHRLGKASASKLCRLSSLPENVPTTVPPKSKCPRTRSFTKDDMHKIKQTHQKNKTSNLLTVFKIPGDGNCLFSSVAQAILGNHNAGTVAYIRTKAVSYIFDHWTEYSSIVNAIYNYSTAAEYFLNMSQSGIYGDYTEVLALAKVFNCCIEVYRDGTSLLNANDILNEEAQHQGQTVRLHLQNQHYDLITSLNTVDCDHVGQPGDWCIAKILRIGVGHKKERNRFYIGKVSFFN